MLKSGPARPPVSRTAVWDQGHPQAAAGPSSSTTASAWSTQRGALSFHLRVQWHPWVAGIPGRPTASWSIFPFPVGLSHQTPFLDPRTTVIAFQQAPQAGPGFWCCKDTRKAVVPLPMAQAFLWLLVPLSCKITSHESTPKPEHLCSRLLHEHVFSRSMRHTCLGTLLLWEPSETSNVPVSLTLVLWHTTVGVLVLTCYGMIRVVF